MAQTSFAQWTGTNPVNQNGSANITDDLTVGDRIGVGTTTPQAALDLRMPHEEEIILQSVQANTYTGFNFKHSDGTENFRIRAYSNYPGGYGNMLGIIAPNGGNLWMAVDKAYIGNIDFANCTDCNDYKLFVRKGIRTEKIKVDVSSGVWSDYVFDEDYKLRSLIEVDEFIQNNHHLPDVPSSECVEEEGIDLAKTDALLLSKIEELTLYLIEQQKQNTILVEEIKQLKNDVNGLMNNANNK
ncbi:MAG: hypothetical protein COA58_13290 [Bacteroidetes bacterium]|nr:MAG: hypothetical protein COA58_13290 [Bacteroidota bacterium]